VAAGLARLEVPVRLLARIAANPLGRRIPAHVTGDGVDLSWKVKASEPTSLAIVAAGPDGSPEHDFRVEGTADWQWRDAELTGVLNDRVARQGPAIVAVTQGPAASLRRRARRRSCAVPDAGSRSSTPSARATPS
jgi:fructokinase